MGTCRDYMGYCDVFKEFLDSYLKDDDCRKKILVLFVRYVVLNLSHP